MEINNYVYESNATIKSLARQTLKNRWAEALLAIFIYNLLIDAPSLLLSEISESTIMNSISLTLSMAVNAPLALGLSVYFLKVFRRADGGIADLKTGFKYFANAFLLYIMEYVQIRLWLMLFVIPGIIAAIRYSQAFFIMADNPEKSALQCLAESCMMIRGNKDRYFRFQLSFIGWVLLAQIPNMAIVKFKLMPQIESMMASHPELLNSAVKLSEYILNSGILEPNIWTFLASLGMLLVTVYIYTAKACFYDLLTGSLVVTHQNRE